MDFPFRGYSILAKSPNIADPLSKTPTKAQAGKILIRLLSCCCVQSRNHASVPKCLYYTNQFRLYLMIFVHLLFLYAP